MCQADGRLTDDPAGCPYPVNVDMVSTVKLRPPSQWYVDRPPGCVMWQPRRHTTTVRMSLSTQQHHQPSKPFQASRLETMEKSARMGSCPFPCFHLLVNALSPLPYQSINQSINQSLFQAQGPYDTHTHTHRHRHTLTHNRV